MRDGIKGIAFDLDGTLYPNYRLNLRLVPFILKEWRMLAAFGKARNIIRNEQRKSPPCRECFYEHQADITAQILKVPAGPLKIKIDNRIYKGWEPLFKKIKLYKHVIETLEGLKKAGFKLGLLSDFPPETKLEYLKISGYWDAVHCSENSGALKPHPLSFTELAGAMALPAQCIMYVGNSHTYDVAGAASAGMKTAWIKSRFVSAEKKEPKPDFFFHSYRQLYDFMIK
ncbi:MAG: HAD family hydrolase [Treponema sp.]|nr:HAD family hydrolase [Treponema sp.]